MPIKVIYLLQEKSDTSGSQRERLYESVQQHNSYQTILSGMLAHEGLCAFIREEFVSMIRIQFMLSPDTRFIFLIEKHYRGMPRQPYFSNNLSL